MPKSIVFSVIACLTLIAAGCGPTSTAGSTKPHPGQSPPTKKTSRAVRFPDEASRACMGALKPMGVPVQTLDWPGSVGADGPAWRRITLPESLTGGPEAKGRSQSPLQTAYENFLSSAVGYPLIPYLGRMVTEVDLIGGRSGMSGYVCLEDHGRVVGVWGQQSGYTAQPEFLVTAKGQTFESLAGTDFLSWLVKSGYYAPSSDPNSSSFTAEEALKHAFAVMNDTSLSASQERSLLATYNLTAQPTKASSPDKSPLLALVPIQITPWTGGSGAAPQTRQEFGVRLWPHWRSFPPVPLAGNGSQYMFYVMVRPAGSTLWKIQSEGTGP